MHASLPRGHLGFGIHGAGTGAWSSPTDKELRAFHTMVEDMKLILNEGWGEPPKRGLAGTPEQRRRQALRRLGELHGRDYLAEEGGSD